MSICPTYHSGIKHTVSPEITQHRQTVLITTEAPWCTDSNSPATLAQVSSIGGANLLKCGGDIKNCTISANH